jgi:hypothetical protein
MYDLAINIVLVRNDLPSGRDFHNPLASRLSVVLPVSGNALFYPL